jgi:tellurite methyltransferase
MEPLTINALLGNTDIYLIDQILKGRYRSGQRILDAGAGGGRNLQWFLRHDFEVFATDREASAVEALRQQYPLVPATRFATAPVESMPFPDAFFDHVICCAVYHFAESPEHFRSMFSETLRVLRPGGTLFVRVASDIGIEDRVHPLGNGVYRIPDGSTRFLLTRAQWASLLQEHPIRLLEPFKTVNVDDLRSMATLIIERFA